MSDDDELRDGFGAQLTAALNLRSRTDDPAVTAVAVQPRAHRPRSRRRVLVGALAIVLLGGAIPILVGRAHGSDRIRTINPAGTTTETPRTTRPNPTPTSQPTPSTAPAVPPDRVVTTTGVGSLRFGVATEADVREAIGAPDATVDGSFGVSSFPGYRALGYQCSSNKSAHGMHIGPSGSDAPPYCRTVYFINVSTATLAGFDTTTTGYATARGTTVGMTAAQAEHRQSRPVVRGCLSGIQIGSGSTAAEVFVFVATQTTDAVNGIAADNHDNTVGVLFC